MEFKMSYKNLNSISSMPTWPIELFKKAIEEIPAYREHIQANGLDIQRIHTMDDYPKIPVINKNYLSGNSRRAIFAGGELPVSASCSSGSSGLPTYWFRSEADDLAAAKGYKHLIADVLNIKKEERVLALVCFAMGSWVAGTLTVDCLKLIAAEGYQLTIFPAGIEREDGLNALRILGPEFDRILIYGYPPLLLDFVKDAHERNIPMGEKVSLIPAGDKNSEQWRETIAALAGCPQEQVVSFYGSADALYMACETPLSLAIKKEALQNPELYQFLFGETHVASMPGMYQYDEDRLYLEAVNNELILTIDRTLPLIRYNLRDRVKILNHQEMRAALSRFDLQNKKIFELLDGWKNPFVIVGSRTDVAVNYYGINIYYDNIKNITDHPENASLLSGSYMTYIENKYAESVQNFHIEFELNNGIPVTAEITAEITASAIHVLKESSSEFRKLCDHLQNKADPIVRIVAYGGLKLNSLHTGIYAVKGKKPYMINNKTR